MKARIAVGMMLVVIATMAAIPRTIQYQGKLTDMTGVGENDTLDIRFRVFDVETGGDSLWAITIADVPIVHGLFDVNIGPIDLPFDEQYWLEIIVDGNVLAPRVQLTSSPYAFRSAVADSFTGGISPWTQDTMIAHWDSIRGVPAELGLPGGSNGQVQYNSVGAFGGASQLYYNDLSGNVGVGTNNPLEKLTVANGDIKIENTGTARLILHENSTPTSFFIRRLTDGFLIDEGGVDRLYIANGTGNVGIGTTSPWYPFHVRKAGESIFAASIENVHETGWGLEIRTIDTTSTRSSLEIYNGFVQNIWVRNSGRVGIGVDPTCKLDVAGKTKTNDFQMTVGASNGFVLQSDATGNASWVNPTTISDGDWTISGSNMYSAVSGNVGIGTNSPTALLHTNGTGTGEGNILFVGQWKTSSPGNPPVEGAGTRMMWYPDKAAFRAGSVLGTEWNRSNTGDNSAAFGYNTTASGYASTAMGNSTTASGAYSTAMGNSTTASGSVSTAMGSNTTASGYASTAMGRSTTAPSGFETVIGRYNTTYAPVDTTGWNDADRLFVIGNGTSDLARSNAMTVLKNGNVGIGTTAPNRMLTISGTTPEIQFVDTDAFSYNWHIGQSSGAFIITQSGLADRLVINVAGNICIGTTTTEAKMEIFSNSTFTKPQLLLKETGADFARLYFSNTDVATFFAIVAKPADNPTDAKMNFNYGGDRMTIQGDGNVGIGTTNPVSLFHIEAFDSTIGTNDSAFISIRNKCNADSVLTGVRFKNHNQDGNIFYKSAIAFQRTGTWGRGDLHFLMNNQENNLNAGLSWARMTLTGAGNLGIGTTTPIQKMHIAGGTLNYYRVSTDGNSGLDLGQQETGNGLIRLRDNADLIFYTNNIERVRLTNTGNVGIGMDSPSYQLQLSTNSAAKPISNVWTVPSDSRLKENISPYSVGIESLMKIEPVWFTYTGEANMPRDTGVGVIAQDLQEIAPYMVNTWTHDDGNGNQTEYLGVDNGAMTYMLINAVKELRAENEELREKNTALETQNREIIERIERLEKAIQE